MSEIIAYLNTLPPGILAAFIAVAGAVLASSVALFGVVITQLVVLWLARRGRILTLKREMYVPLAHAIMESAMLVQKLPSVHYRKLSKAVLSKNAMDALIAKDLAASSEVLIAAQTCQLEIASWHSRVMSLQSTHCARMVDVELIEKQIEDCQQFNRGLSQKTEAARNSGMLTAELQQLISKEFVENQTKISELNTVLAKANRDKFEAFKNAQLMASSALVPIGKATAELVIAMRKDLGLKPEANRVRAAYQRGSGEAAKITEEFVESISKQFLGD